MQRASSAAVAVALFLTVGLAFVWFAVPQLEQPWHAPTRAAEPASSHGALENEQQPADSRNAHGTDRPNIGASTAQAPLGAWSRTRAVPLEQPEHSAPSAGFSSARSSQAPSTASPASPDERPGTSGPASRSGSPGSGPPGNGNDENGGRQRHGAGAGAGTGDDLAQSPDEEPQAKADDDLEPDDEDSDDQAEPDGEPGPEEDESPSRRSISGWALFEGGLPAPELTVMASARGLLESLSDTALAPSSGQLNTVSDENGFFLFAGLTEGEYEVRTDASNQYESARAVLRTGVDSAVLVVRKKSERQVHVYGIVEDARAGLLPGVRVVPSGQPAQAVATDDLGEYSLSLKVGSRAPNYPLRFLREQFREARLTLTEADFRDREEVELNVLMEPIEEVVTVTGMVVSDDELPVHRASVQLFSSSLERTHRAVTDRTGRFTVAEVEVASDYRLWVRPEDRYKDYIEDGVAVTSGLELAIVLESQGSGSLSGQMVDPLGQPLPGFTLWAHPSHATERGPILASADEEGFFFVEDLPDGELVLRTHAVPDLSVTGIDLFPGEVRDARIPLDVGSHALEGYVRGGQGQALAGARVLVLWDTERDGVRSRSRRETVTDANGFFLVTRLGPGPHTVNVSAPGFRGARLEHPTGTSTAVVQIRLTKASSESTRRR